MEWRLQHHSGSRVEGLCMVNINSMGKKVKHEMESAVQGVT